MTRRRRDRSDLFASINPITVGDKVFFPTTGEQPESRDTYKAVHGIAYRLWGAGAYFMESKAGGFWLGRLKTGQPIVRQRSGRKALGAKP